MKNLFLFLLSVSITFNALSKNLFEGEINYKITYSDVPEDMKMALSMMPTKAKMILKNEWSRYEQSMGLVGNMAVISNSLTKKSFSLVDFLGKKIAIENKDTSSVQSVYKKIEHTKLKKKIAGYKCKKILLTDTANNLSEIWVTKKIQASSFSGVPLEISGGFVLEYVVKTKGMKMTISATKVEKRKVTVSEFKIPDGYEKMTLEEFEESMKNFK